MIIYVTRTFFCWWYVGMLGQVVEYDFGDCFATLACKRVSKQLRRSAPFTMTSYAQPLDESFPGPKLFCRAASDPVTFSAGL